MLTKYDLYQEALESFLASPDFTLAVYGASWTGQYNYVALGVTEKDHTPTWIRVHPVSYDGVYVARFVPNLTLQEFAVRIPFLRGDKFRIRPNWGTFEELFYDELNLIRDFLREKVERSLAPYLRLQALAGG